MNRNTQERFALNPVNIDIQRSRFLMTPEVKTSFSAGDLVPLGAPLEVLPGDTFEISEAMAVRMQPLVSAPFDNLSFSIYYFFVPLRLLWDHFKQFMGENTESAWIPQTEYTVPTVKLFKGAHTKSVADYMGLPIYPQYTHDESDINQHIVSVNVLPFRGFAMIYNEWFRNQNIVSPLMVHTDDTIRSCPIEQVNPELYNDPKYSTELGGILPKVSKRPDYFTKALPGPQKGIDLTIMDHMPVYVDPDRIRDAAEVNSAHQVSNLAFTVPTNNDETLSSGVANRSITWNAIGGSPYSNIHLAQPNNWYVDGNLTISALRTAFQIQKLYEKDARGGTRYREMLKAHFGVNSPDASQQVPQYLGGRDIPININSVIQTSESGDTPQGNVAGYSLTANGNKNHSFIQSFTEHGYLYAVGCARIDQHTYQNGVHRLWSRKNRTDFYFPVLANISEQPILNKEIFSVGSVAEGIDPTYELTDDQVFGYQEAWAEYRYFNSYCTSEMRSNISKSLDSWHFADDYDTLPSLSESWIQEDKSNIDRALAVQSSVADQFYGDFRFNIKATRPMPMYSIPGLIDHH